MEQALKWMYDKMAAKVTYSMVYRNGPSSYDCSSAVYYSLIQQGRLAQGHRIGNTDSLFNDLEKSGWVKTGAPKRGDIFIWGRRGASGGAAGHTGFFVNATDIIHCAAGYNGIHVDNHAWLRSINGNPEVTVYTYTGAAAAVPYIGDTDQNVDIGSYIKFDKSFVVDAVQLIGGIWQIRTNELCKNDFTWDDNGIPAGPVYEVDNEGYATPDQDLNIGSIYRIPGKFTILDIGQNPQGAWLAMIERDGLKFWVDIETATEVLASDAGTPTPGQRPAPPQEPVAPPVTTPEPPKKPEEPETPNNPIEETKPTTEATEPPKEPIKEKPTMAFTQGQQAELAVQQQKVLEANGDFNPVISEKTKTIAYFATDLGTLVSVFILTVMAVLNMIDGNTAIYLAAAISALMVGTKATFRLSSKKQ